MTDPSASPPAVSGALTVGDAGERRVIALIRSLVPAPPPWLITPIGDDAAVYEPERQRMEVQTVDALVEGVHFERAYVDPGSIGFKALAVNLSDLASMGAAPRTALLSLSLPASWPLADLEAMIRAMLDLAARTGVTLIGGNVTRSPGPIFIDVMLTGSIKRRRVLTRAGARPGDELFVSGTLGAAAAGFAWLRERAETRPAAFPADGHEPDMTDAVRGAVRRFLRPEPRLRFGVVAGRTRAAGACVDLSDGLADAVRHLSSASGVGVTLEVDALPVDPGATEILGEGTERLKKAVLTGGEDYELLFAVPRRARRRFLAAQRLAGVPATRIGFITADKALLLRSAHGDAALPDGFEHFV